MAKFLFFAEILPLLLLCLAWFAGSKPWGFATFFLVCYWLIGGMLIHTYVANGGSLLFEFFAILVIFITGPSFAAVVGITFGGTAEKSPSEKVAEGLSSAGGKAYQAYSGLDDAQKAKVAGIVFAVAKHGLAYLAAKLAEKNRKPEAVAVRKASKLF